MYERIVLPNGARIVCEHMDGVRSASLGIWVGAGSRYERYSEAGSAHFIEHMLFKGTSRWSAAELAERMDAVGGQMNAYTTRDNTCFYARVLDTHLPLATDTLCAMFFDSRFDERDVENEKGIIQEEIDMYEDTPEDVAAERLIAGCFPGALGRPVLGRSSSLARQTGESLRAFMARHYAAPRVVAALSGSFTDEDLRELARRFSAMPAAKPKKPERSAYRPCLTLRRKATEQNQLVLGFPGLETASSERFALQLLSGILGGNASSRLFQSVREKHGLCYSIYSFTAGFEDTGLFAVAAAAEAGGKVIGIDRFAVGTGIREDLGAIDSRYQKAWGTKIDKFEFITMATQYAGGHIQQDLVKIWCDKSGEAIDWVGDRLAERNIELWHESGDKNDETRYKHFAIGHSPKLPIDPKTGKFKITLAQVVEQYAAKKGARFDYNTKMVKLEKKNGRVTGVIAENADGNALRRLRIWDAVRGDYSKA